MAKRSIHGFVELASGLGELTRSRAKEAATELLALTGVEGSSKKVAKQASKLADDLLVAAETNRKQVVRLVRSEVEAALGRVDVGRLVGEVQGLGATVAALAAQVDDLARSAAGRPAPSAPARVVEPEPARVASRPAPAKKRPAKRTSSSATATPAATTAPAKKAPAKKAPAKKAATTATKKAPAKKATSTATKKAPAKKAPAKKAATTAAKKAPAKKATTKTAAKKATSTAAKKAPARKEPATKASAPAATTGTA